MVVLKIRYSELKEPFNIFNSFPIYLSVVRYDEHVVVICFPREDPLCSTHTDSAILIYTLRFERQSSIRFHCDDQLFPPSI